MTYHAETKQKLLGVKKEPLATYTAESQQTANEMAQGLQRHLFHADVCVAVTGLRGPGASESPDKPVGTMFGTILIESLAHEYRTTFPDADANKLRQQTTDFIYQRLDELPDRREATQRKPVS